MKRAEYTFIALLLLAIAIVCRFSGCDREAVPQNKISTYFPRQGDDAEKVLLHLYSKVTRGGYIYVAIYSFTNERICGALKAAKERGVEVRIISDRENAYDTRDDRQRKILRALKEVGVPIKVNAYGNANDHSCMHMKVSIINDRFVVTGSCNYTNAAFGEKKGNEENIIIIPARVDKKSVERYKTVFEKMWNDEKNYRDFN